MKKVDCVVAGACTCFLGDISDVTGRNIGDKITCRSLDAGDIYQQLCGHKSQGQHGSTDVIRVIYAATTRSLAETGDTLLQGFQGPALAIRQEAGDKGSGS